MLDHHYGQRELTFSHITTLFNTEPLAITWRCEAKTNLCQEFLLLARSFNRNPTRVEQAIQIFEATLMAKSSVSLEELTRDDTGTPRSKELMGGADEPIAQKKAVSFLYTALGETAREILLDRKPDITDIKATNLKDLLKECNDAFQKKRNRLMDRHKLLNRKQKDDGSLEQFCPKRVCRKL